MTLRRRIALAVAGGATAVVLLVGIVLYLTVGAALRHEIDRSLRARGAQVEALLPKDPGAVAQRRPILDLPGDPLGGATGAFQAVSSSGASQRATGVPQLPISPRVLAVARSGKGSFYIEATVQGEHLRILTMPGGIPGTALQVARPLAEVDAVQSRLLWIFAAAAALGLLLSAALGGLIGRAALLPISRFSTRSESTLDHDRVLERLDETGPAELLRLASSFNRALDALARAGQAQRALVADASHELRTPIAALRSDIEILLDAGALAVSERAALQASILSELDELTELVANVVELARPGAEAGEARDIALDEVVRDAVRSAKRRSPQINIELDFVGGGAAQPDGRDPSMFAIRHVPDRVERAVMNVIDNARRYTPPGATITVVLRGSELQVIDDGPGFEATDLPFVFDRFYRAQSARSRPGSGLGLAIVRQTAETFGGNVSASNADGRGAQVRVRFGSSEAPSQSARVSPVRDVAASTPCPSGLSEGCKKAGEG